MGFEGRALLRSVQLWGALYLTFSFSIFAADLQPSPLNTFHRTIGKQGFWQLTQDQRGIWWFINPVSLKLEFMNTVTSVQPYQLARLASGPHYSSRHWKGPLAPTPQVDINASWAQQTIPEILSSGFKGLGAWCHPIFHQFDIPVSRDLNIFPTLQTSILNPEWKKEAVEIIRKLVEPLRENKNLVGYFADNEVNWDVFPMEVVRDYFEFVAQTIRAFDPNHLLLGVRFKMTPSIALLEQTRGVFDVLSVNYYPNEREINEPLFTQMHQAAQMPILVSEYSYHSKDNRSGSPNTVQLRHGEVSSQIERALRYKSMTQSMARMPFVVGADWFQWNDEPPSGRSSDGEDINFGVIDVHDKPYEELVRSIQETEPTLNPLHASSYN